MDEDILDYMLGRREQINPVRPEPSQAPMGVPQQEDITVQGYKPRPKAGWLGQILDTLMVMKGRSPAFQDRKDTGYIQDIMRDRFADDPAGALRAIAAVNPKLGMSMMNTYEDNQRLQQNADTQRLVKQEMFRNRAASMFGALDNTKPENRAEVYKLIRPQYLKYLQDHGIMDEDIPEDYDEDQVRTIVSGGIPLKDQAQIAYRKARLGQMGERLQQQGANTESLIESRQNANSNRTEHTNIAKRKAGGSDYTYQGKNVTVTKKGDQRMTVDNRGIQVGWKLIAGKWRPMERRIPTGEGKDGYRREINVNGTWKPVGVEAEK